MFPAEHGVPVQAFLAQNESMCVPQVLPIDNAKTHIQTSRPGPLDVGLLRQLQAIVRAGSVRSLWAGLGPTIVRAFPANAAQWVAWELSVRALELTEP